MTDIKVWTGALEKGFEGMLDNLQSSLTSGDDGDGGDGGDGGGDDEGGTGIGAGISVNIIVAEDTKQQSKIMQLSSGGAIEVSASMNQKLKPTPLPELSRVRLAGPQKIWMPLLRLVC